VVVFHAGDVERDGPAGGLLLALVVARQVRTDGRPAHAVVGALEHHFRRGVDHVGIVRRNDDGLRPLEAMGIIFRAVAGCIQRKRRNILRLLGAMVVAGHHYTVVARDHHVVVARVGRDVAAFTTTYVIPVALGDHAL